MKTNLAVKHIKEAIRKNCGGGDGRQEAAEAIHAMIVAELKTQEPLNAEELNGIIKMLTEEKADIIKREQEKEDKFRSEWFESDKKLREELEALSKQVEQYEIANQMFKERCDTISAENAELKSEKESKTNLINDLSISVNNLKSESSVREAKLTACEQELSEESKDSINERFK